MSFVILILSVFSAVGQMTEKAIWPVMCPVVSNRNENAKMDSRPYLERQEKE